MPTVEDFRRELRAQFRLAKTKGASYIEVNSGDLHRKLGGYPGQRHAMPSCCNVMNEEKGISDTVVSSPPKGRGASLTIRYKIPR